jgi:multidrug efflux system membrane fusion protein
MKTTRIVLAVIGVLALAAVIVIMRKAGAQPANGAPAASASAGDRVIPVATAVATRKDVPVLVEGLGTVTPLQTVTLKTQVDGRLDRVLFTEGQAVKKGEVIALVDPRPFEIQLHTGEAALFRDDAQLKNAKLNLDRYQQLRAQNLIPQQQVDDQRTTVDQLEAATRTDKAQIETARLNLDYARIASPIDGVTGIRQVDPGNLVHASDANGIVLITQIDPIGVLFTIPQDELARVQNALTQGKVSVDVYGRDGQKKIATGDLLLIDNQVNAQTATIKLKAVFPNPDKALWPNAFVKARVQLETLKNALVVPAAVVQRGPNGAFAYVVAPDKTASPKSVEVVSIEGEQAIIGKGLNENDVVVTDGQNQLKPGSKVAPRETTRAAASAAAPHTPLPPTAPPPARDGRRP